MFVIVLEFKKEIKEGKALKNTPLIDVSLQCGWETEDRK